MRFMLFVVLLTFLVPKIGSAGEIIRGDLMSEKGMTVHETRMTLLPHAEVEYGYFDVSGGNAGNSSDTGVAVGVTIGKNKFFTDLYTRQSIESGDSEVSNYGVTLTYLISNTVYASLGVEQQTIEIDEFDSARQYWKSDELRIKPSLGGFAVAGEKATLFAGVGLIIGFADIEVDQTDFLPSGINGVREVRYKESLSSNNLGVFCQLKYGYSLTENLMLLASIAADLETSVDDQENDGESFASDQFMLFTRAGLQYRF